MAGVTDVTRWVTGLGSSFQFGSLSHSSLRSAALVRARSRLLVVAKGPSRSMGGQMSLARLDAVVLDAEPELAGVRVAHVPKPTPSCPSIDWRGDSVGPRRDLPAPQRARRHRVAGVRRQAGARALHRVRGQGRRHHRADAHRRPARRAGPRARRRARRSPASPPTSSTGSATSSCCDHGAYPSTLGYKGFPKSLCTQRQRGDLPRHPRLTGDRGRRHRQHRHHRLHRRRARRHQRHLPRRRRRRGDPAARRAHPRGA